MDYADVQLSEHMSKLYDLRVIVAVVVLQQLDIRTCTAEIVHKLTLLQRFDDAVITFIKIPCCDHHHAVITFTACYDHLHQNTML